MPETSFTVGGYLTINLQFLHNLFLMEEKIPLETRAVNLA
jgi:hypothetical protein